MIEVDAISETATPSVARERRAAVRYSCRLDEPCRLTIRQRHESRWARVKDISALGISVLVCGPLDPGTSALLRVCCRRGEPALDVPVKVVHSVAQADGNWLVGCKFESTLDKSPGSEPGQVHDVLMSYCRKE